MSRKALIIQQPHSRAIWFVTGDAWNNTGGGKSSYLTTSYGTQYELQRLAHDGSVAESVTVNTGVSVW